MEEPLSHEELKKKFSHIKGWAIDADPENEPNYPYKIYTGDDHKRLNWDRPPLQEKTVEILQSTEHERTPATFGTVAPPKGVSGAIRKQAFGYSENMLRHWLMLIFADRVDVVEGVISDLSHGKIPAWWKERGFEALWEHDKKLLMKRAMIRTLFYSAAAGFLAWMILKDDEETKAEKRLKRTAMAGS
jgi:hypothetical protein